MQAEKKGGGRPPNREEETGRIGREIRARGEEKLYLGHLEKKDVSQEAWSARRRYTRNTLPRETDVPRYHSAEVSSISGIKEKY